MAKFKILVIAHALKNNVIAKYGEVVDESQLTAPAFELVQDGFISLQGDGAIKEEKKPDSATAFEQKASVKDEIKSKLQNKK